MNNKQLKALADSVIESISKLLWEKDVIEAFICLICGGMYY